MNLQDSRNALIGVIRTEGVVAVVWRDRSGTHSFTKALDSEDVRVDDEWNTNWVTLSEAAFRAQDATRHLASHGDVPTLAGPVTVAVQLKNFRCLVAPAKGAMVMVVAQKKHGITKSLARTVRNAITRLDKVYVAEMRQEHDHKLEGNAI